MGDHVNFQGEQETGRYIHYISARMTGDLRGFELSRRFLNAMG